MGRVFVYGSLMRGGEGHYLLARARYLGEARTCEPYFLHTGWRWPLLIDEAPDALKASICGELYGVSQTLLRQLDAFEDEGTLYARRQIRVCTKMGEQAAWCWFARDKRLIAAALRTPRPAWAADRRCQKFRV
ncbi:Uncharacterized conserved protein YtfP, gamma-glutamylcyclotransferase (GGCT)/AIG2-like family [Sulfurivirga caldicuralii]|uniref:Gamma-glutamylcyclotransferase family protein n=1 Tax=Sulfurivirga caldicuralii TaxID=364032 RepID=A0A1N6GX57_9GAMM|nr:gamma-glutamylcyclotransferase family protein [Sulfurivirga caldicuralii]SIO12042.1 Uncharacterized conserved protein YtfP, gamma-glutamylcyclotransferase (GGCT)/AIG2-like family [Sulfurivirga caldicuralii]